MIEIPITIKHNLRDSTLFQNLSKCFSNFFGIFFVIAKSKLLAIYTCKCYTILIINCLSIQIAIRSKNAHTRLRCDSKNRTSNSQLSFCS
ncbi:Uncharacterised protein [Helicobacter pametensis]|nr:Uncharacterised protein [Helicobacter pametensis]